MNREYNNFIIESNKIEGIYGFSDKELVEFNRFMALDKITVEELKKFVKVYQSDAVLRDRKDLNVRVGNYYPPLGGLDIRIMLEDIIKDIRRDNAYKIHIRYEKLHPFTDGNGRSGRMIWAWQERRFPLGFLHKFYYQTLDNAG